MLVKEKDTVKIHYIGKFEDGEVFEDSHDEDPLIFKLGEGMMIPGLEKGIIGMRVGEKKEIIIPVNEGYGDIDPQKYIEIPKKDFPKDHELELGMEMEIIDDNENEFPAIIKEIKENSIIMDANHPLAGETLVFEVELLEIGSKLIIVEEHHHHHHDD